MLRKRSDYLHCGEMIHADQLFSVNFEDFVASFYSSFSSDWSGCRNGADKMFVLPVAFLPFDVDSETCIFVFFCELSNLKERLFYIK
jgi:hypothetical protein